MYYLCKGLFTYCSALGGNSSFQDLVMEGSYYADATTVRNVRKSVRLSLSHAAKPDAPSVT